MPHRSEEERVRTTLSGLFEEYPLIEAFTPLHRSQLWSLNAAYWSRRGLRAFTDDAVPYLATSDGTLAAATARLLAALARARGSGAMGQLAVVEVGPGSGLYARLTMRNYLDLQAADSNLPKLLYIAVDSSGETIQGLAEQKILGVPGCDVVCIEADLARDLGAFQVRVSARLPRGVPAICVCNYVLDSLPATTLRKTGDELHEAQVELRTWTSGEPRSRNASRPRMDQRLDEILMRTRHRPIAEAHLALPMAQRFLTEEGGEIPFNVQAIAFIRTLAAFEGRVDTILVNDYGVDSLTGGAEPVQYFAGSVAMGLHFPTLDAYVAEALGWVSTPPAEKSETIVSRLFTAKPDAALQSAYAELFSLRESKRAHSWASVARRAKSEGRFDRAMSAYDAALDASPWNWSLLVEAAHFVQSCLRRDDTALQLANQALEANPICPQAWNIIGDCRYNAGDLAAARQAFENALRVHANDARALLNLAYCQAQEGNFEQALASISRGLAADRGGALTHDLLERQQEILKQLSSTAD